jgi:hypothetical protein
MKRNYVSCRMLYEAEKSRKKKVKLIVSLIKHETFYCQRDFIVSHKLLLRFIFAKRCLRIDDQGKELFLVNGLAKVCCASDDEVSLGENQVLLEKIKFCRKSGFVV